MEETLETKFTLIECQNSNFRAYARLLRDENYGNYSWGLIFDEGDGEFYFFPAHTTADGPEGDKKIKDMPSEYPSIVKTCIQRFSQIFGNNYSAMKSMDNYREWADYAEGIWANV